ncbi:Regulatory protein BlaR1 [Posidoniimonas polymericola]|uniref:Regulatory protein BlaR1 n=1 Tax=Posidoniimonas polymericola TaxID=2528002 RepID=A0A5C5ZEZ1_9BACT|nr:M56 family metallopeptidase [Posidoniimonas polymericola]TWT85738.1 Regulatory protein BlaR1 [Posidoniimonas polymericola]
MRGFIHPIEELFECFANAGIAAVAVVLLVWLVDRVAGKRIAPGIRAALWLLVAARLMMPVAPESLYSVQRAWSLLEGDRSAVAVAEPQLNHTETAAASPTPSPTIPATATPAAPPSRAIWDDVLFWILMTAWPAGVAWVLLRATLASVRFAWQLRRCPAEDDTSVVDVVLHACDEVGVRRPRIKRVPSLGAPALFGVLRPTLCLPADEPLTSDELRMVALHEAAHLRRRDCLTAWLLTPVRALHWCNPIAWLALGRYERYREQACDEAVRRRLPAAQLKDYADLLLRFASAGPAPAAGLVGIWFARSARELGARIEALSEATPRFRRAPQLLGAALLAVVAVVTLTDPASSRSDNAHDRLPLQTSPYSWAFDGPDADAVELRTYDLSEALAKIQEVHPDAENPRAWLLAFSRMQGGKPRALPPEGSRRVAVRATKAVHQLFSTQLEEVARSGHTWQVFVSTRVIRAAKLDDLPGVDWTRSVAFPDIEQEPVATPFPHPAGGYSTTPGLDFNGDVDEPLFTTKSVVVDYSPFIAATLDAAATDALIEKWQAHPRRGLYQAPKVTLFSGQQAMVRDQSQTPFVLGVDYVRGESATAAQPNIAVLSEGAEVRVLPRVIDDQTLDLNCQLLLSHIDDVGTTTLPNREVTVQSLRMSKRTLTARCRMQKGQTLLMAPLPPDDKGNEPEPAGAFCYAVTVDWFADTPNGIEIPKADP